MYNMKVIKLPFACSEFFVHTQNQRQTGSFVRTKFGFLHNVPLFFERSESRGILFHHLVRGGGGGGGGGGGVSPEKYFEF